MAELRVPCEVYSRIVGYFRPTYSWNKGKLQELAERKDYVVKEVKDHGDEYHITIAGPVQRGA